MLYAKSTNKPYGLIAYRMASRVYKIAGLLALKMTGSRSMFANYLTIVETKTASIIPNCLRLRWRLFWFGLQKKSHQSSQIHL